jgi:hypothetical protein
MARTPTANTPDPPDPPDPDRDLMRHVVTLGLLIKILLAIGGLLAALGGYEVVQLDKLRDQTSTLQATIGGLEVKMTDAEKRLGDMQTKVDNSGGLMADILKNVLEIRRQTENGQKP